MDRSRAERDLAGADYWPDLTLGVDYRFRKDIAGDPVHGADFLNFKIGFNLPLWFFAGQNNRARAAHQRAMAAREQERSVMELLTVKLKDLRQRLELNYSSLRRYDESVIPQAEAALKATEAAYEVGKGRLRRSPDGSDRFAGVEPRTAGPASHPQPDPSRVGRTGRHGQER